MGVTGDCRGRTRRVRIENVTAPWAPDNRKGLKPLLYSVQEPDSWPTDPASLKRFPRKKEVCDAQRAVTVGPVTAGHRLCIVSAYVDTTLDPDVTKLI